MTSHISEINFFYFSCSLRAKRRAQGCAAHFEASIRPILRSVAAHQGSFAPKSVPGGPKSVPGAPKIGPWGSKIGPWGVLGGSWRASRELQGLRKAPRALQGAPRGQFWEILDECWSNFGVIVVDFLINKLLKLHVIFVLQTLQLLSEKIMDFTPSEPLI